MQILTNYMGQSPSWEADRSLVSQEIPRILWVHYVWATVEDFWPPKSNHCC
jgi:hypothetical protein